jgi:hypothetical protein
MKPTTRANAPSAVVAAIHMPLRALLDALALEHTVYLRLFITNGGGW